MLLKSNVLANCRKTVLFFSLLVMFGCSYHREILLSSKYKYDEKSDNYIQIEQRKPLILKPGEAFFLSIKFSEPVRQINVNIGEKDIEFIKDKKDETVYRSKTVFIFNEGDSQDDPKFVRITAEDLAGNKLFNMEAVGPVVPAAYLRRDEKGEFPEIPKAMEDIIIPIIIERHK
ncbi:MAG: hypothetical protein A2231_09655 [Candidatus Firestonebacteria bacterium RIFOXYA2_FULL_40_8]|nr:MAG: hypothetical protein A2231_09655 [Candidatus Firestonebacteria bacterium RIFOXYA2_FULL_40_8]